MARFPTSIAQMAAGLIIVLGCATAPLSGTAGEHDGYRGFLRQLQPSPSTPPLSMPHAARLNKALRMDDDMTAAQQQSFGCLVGGTTGLGVSMAAGGSEVVNIIAGGVVPIGSNLALGTALVGVIFGSFCVIGQALTPSALYVIERVQGKQNNSPPDGLAALHAASARKYLPTQNME